ncbi:MAG: glycosyltransferase family 2 protein [Dehalococcoidia bacterium]
MNKEKPLISCLMVTRGVNPEIIDGALYCYANQTWKNKELVVVTDCDTETRNGLIDLLNKYKDHNIKLVYHEHKLPMGALRNVSINHASGDYCVQWDDDDLCHAERIEKQYEAIIGDDYDYCLLTEFMMYFKNTHILSTNRWSIHNYIGGIPSSIMFKTSIDYKYPDDIQYGEDVEIAKCFHLKELLIKGMPHLYVYVYHGGNSYDYDHYLKIYHCTNTPFNMESFGMISPLLNYMGMDYRF